MGLSPMMQRYLATKKKYPDCIIFYRLGDFYEMFFEDAEVASKALSLTLTGRDCGLEKRAPMCGVPHHAWQGYVKKLVDQGFKVAICEQVGPVQKGKGLVEREVVRIITAGTISDENFLEQSSNNYIAAVYRDERKGSVSWCDVTTGQFYALEAKSEAEIMDAIAMICPAEIVKNSLCELKLPSSQATRVNSGDHYDYLFSARGSHEAILKYFGIVDTIVFDFSKDSAITRSAGALIDYLMLTQKQRLCNITGVKVIKSGEYMWLDKCARENLEIIHPFRDPTSKKGSLRWAVDATKTAMGARLLVDWLGRPLQDVDSINQRLDAVEELAKDKYRAVAEALSKIADIYRLCGKVASGDIMPRDMLSLCRSLSQIGQLRGVVDNCKSKLMKALAGRLDSLPSVVELIEAAISEDAPATVADGGFIRAGYNENLDKYRSSAVMGRTWLLKLEAKERLECELKELKIGYNRVSGYYFEVPLRLTSKVPYRFTRRATTANTERFVTQELKEIEERITGAQEKAVEVEQKMFAKIKEFLKEHLVAMLGNAETVAQIDVLCSFAFVAVYNRWVRPTFGSDGVISLEDARHPVAEKIIGSSSFIANSCRIGGEQSTMILTGPNMAGKSTFMRTVALNVLLAHVGSFVPCSSAEVCITDRIFTRIGASDSVLTGQSTFMVEMNELCCILNGAKKNSLVLLDEIGRGTGTQEGRALASASITYITEKIGCPTMFATHFHELTELAKDNSKIQNCKATTAVIDGQVVFLHKIVPGIEQSSFGIDVAKMAGLPDEVLRNARSLYDADRARQVAVKNEKVGGKDGGGRKDTVTEAQRVVSRLRSVDTNNLTPMEALVVLGEIVEGMKRGAG